MDDDEDFLYPECVSCAFKYGDDPTDICAMCEDADQWEEDQRENSRVIPILVTT